MIRLVKLCDTSFMRMCAPVCRPDLKHTNFVDMRTINNSDNKLLNRLHYEIGTHLIYVISPVNHCRALWQSKPVIIVLHAVFVFVLLHFEILKQAIL